MAFGFTPKYEQTLDLNGLDAQNYLAIALSAAKKLNWDINYISKTGFVAYIGNSIFSSKEEFKVVISDGIVNITSKSLGNGMYDWGKNKKHVEEFMLWFDDIQIAITQEQLIAMIADLDQSFASDEEDKLALPPATALDNLKSFLSFFVPRNGYFITPIIININILIFIIMAISGVSIIAPQNLDLINWGANFGELTLEGQWWRILTNIFLHIGIAHLLFNMYALLYIGLLLEPYLGKLRFATAYLFTGIIASLTSSYCHALTVSAGASGAIFGMYGVFLAMLTTNFIDKSIRKPMLISIGIFVLFNLMNGMKQGIDNAAHVGGLLSGFIIGYGFYPSLKQPTDRNLKYLTIGITTILAVCISFIIYRNIPDDFLKYKKLMKSFEGKESMALEVYRLPKSASKEDILYGLKDRGIYYWNENLALLDEADGLNLSELFKQRDEKLRQYCKLRIKSYEYLIKEVGENTKQYKYSIDSCNTKIQSIIDDLKAGN